MSDETLLRRKIYEAIQAGKLPYRLPEQAWGGPGCGGACAICEKRIEPDEMEYEFELAEGYNSSGEDNPHVHVQCFLAWERVCQNFEATQGRASGLDIAMFDGMLPKAADERMMLNCDGDTTPRRGGQ
jgi:hypothetical protein